MKYADINKEHRRKIKGIINGDVNFEWDDTDLTDTLLGKLPNIHYVKTNEEIKTHTRAINKLIDEYDIYSTNKKDFLIHVEREIDTIRKIMPNWYGVSLLEIKQILKMQEFCLISGHGGIGKSYFVKCLEEQLSKNCIEHLCVYGKFVKSLDNIDVQEIFDVALKQRFVFVVDAINEMNKSCITSVLRILKILKAQHKIQIIATYRTGTLDEVTLKILKKLSAYHYKFTGVSFESAAAQLPWASGIDIYQYEDILYSNNPMQLRILNHLLSKPDKINRVKLKSISTITYIFESYLKKKSKQYWKDTKLIANWMYRNNTKSIDIKSLINLIKNSNQYIEHMKQYNFLAERNNKQNIYFSFTIEALCDYLLARNVIKDLCKKDNDNTYSTIKQKLNNFYGISEIVIISIFDKFAPDYKYIRKILTELDLSKHLSLDTISKIKFEEKSIPSFLSNFNINEKHDLILYFGGYCNKPFNCKNYLNNYYLNNSNLSTIELSRTLSGLNPPGHIKERIKNIIYFINTNKEYNIEYEEPLYFAIWCCASPNIEIRCLATKLLYDIIEIEKNYKNKIRDMFFLINDDYIKESIIHTICASSEITVEDKKFLLSLKNDYYFLMSKSLCRIAKAINMKNDYINWSKVNLLSHSENNKISEKFNRLLLSLDLVEKYLLNFRYWSSDNIEIQTKFLSANKNAVSHLNSKLEKEFSCVQNGECNGWMGLEDLLLKYYNIEKIKDTLDNNSFIYSFENVVKTTFKKYDIEYNGNYYIGDTDSFMSSVLRKTIDISQDRFYGSLMCNYFTNQFASYNSIQNTIGYEIYDPLEYGEEFNITTPISLYQPRIEKMGDIAVTKINRPINLREWVRDLENANSNIDKILEPITYQNRTWKMLSANIDIRDSKKWNSAWNEYYDIRCCTSNDVRITGDENDRYLTIETEDYCNNINKYKNNKDKPFLCKNVPNIFSKQTAIDNTHIVLPPSELIYNLNLKLILPDLVWVNDNNEEIILCNNNKYSYYDNQISGTTFIRNDIFEEYSKKFFIKFFVFTEKNTKFNDDPNDNSRHFEIENRKIKKWFYNYIDNNIPTTSDFKQAKCSKCQYNFSNRFNNSLVTDSIIFKLKNNLTQTKINKYFKNVHTSTR